MYCLIVIVILVFNMNYNTLPYADRILIGDIIAGLIIYSVTANLIYLGLRAERWYGRHLWKPFVLSEIFQENYALQYWNFKKEY